MHLILSRTIINRLLVSLLAGGLSLAAGVAVPVFIGVCGFKAYGEGPANGAPRPLSPSAFSTPPVLAGNAAETKETIDEAAAETIVKTIAECSSDALFWTGRQIKISVSGSIRFNAQQEQPVRMKIYRSAAKDGKYSLIYNDVLKNFQKPADFEPSPQQQLETMKKSLALMKNDQLNSPANPRIQRAIDIMEQRIKEQEKNGGKVYLNPEMFSASLHFNIMDAAPLDSGSNNVFYKIKLCTESGLLFMESNPMKVQLIPRPELADDLKTWTWTPFFPGKDSLEGTLKNGQTIIPASNVPVKGQLASALTKKTYPPVYFNPAAPPQGGWRYSRTLQNQLSSFPPDNAIEVIPVFKEGRFFDGRGQIELKSLKIDGREVGIQSVGRNSALPGWRVPLNYPGTPVAELEFAYGGKTGTLRVQLPPVPTGLRAELLDNGSVKLTWDALAGRIDRKQFLTPPDIKLFRDKRHIHTCDISQTEFIDKQTEPGKVYTYSMALDNASARAQVWSRDKGMTESKIILSDLGNPYPESFKATVYAGQEKPPARPVRVSFWEPALCYDRIGGSGMRLFAAAVRKLGQEADFEVLDRISRNNVVEEKILTMLYEKSTLFKTIPADFTVMVRDYSRQQGNGVELWLIQNKAFDYKEVQLPNGLGQSIYADNDFIAWRIGSISAEELKVPEKAEELGDKLVAEIKRRAFLKSAAPQKDASVPVKFVFNPLSKVRELHMVEESKSIGETVMIGLSNRMPGCNFMTRDNWKDIFSEQNLMREQGENLNRDISGAVSISGYVWQENGKKQYMFILTEIRTGICIGTLQCYGTVEEVTEQLADACKKLRLVIPGDSESTAQAKHELDSEHLKIHNCFLNRFGVVNSEELFKSLKEQPEINIPAFAEKHWLLGNRENAIKTLEKMWKTDKSAWEQLERYHCEMGNYTRALQIVETMMQQENASNGLMPEYCRLRSLMARNAPPEIAANSSADGGRRAAQNEGGNFNNDYFDRPVDRGMEWNLDNDNQFMLKAYFAIAKNPDAKLDDVIKKSDFKSSFTDGVFWVERKKSKEALACDTGLQFMEIKLKQIINKMQNQHRKINLTEMVCIDIMAQLGNPAAQNLLSEINSIELPSSLETLKRIQSGNYTREPLKGLPPKLQDGNYERNLLKTGMGMPLSENLDKLQECSYEPYALVAFKAYKGDRYACKLGLQGLKAGGYFGSGDSKEIYYLMALAGRKEIIAAKLPMLDPDAENNIAAIRWGNQAMLKSLLLEHPELFKADVYFYLIDGINDPDFLNALFNHKSILYQSPEYWIKSALWLGRPLPELYRELTLNYKRGE